MRTRGLLLSLTVGLILLTAPVLSAMGTGESRPAARPRAAEWTVCPAGPPTCDFATVQDAVDAAADGDTIKVATGIYSDTNAYGGLAQVVYITKSVTIRGGYTTDFAEPPDPLANPTVLDAQGAGRVVMITGTIAPALEGLEITGGNATGLGGGPWSYSGVGGGIYVVSATATISNCAISGNVGSTAGYGGGGGVYLWWSDSLLVGNAIQGNTAGVHLGGLCEGGGLAMSESAAELERNLVSANYANSAGYGIGGGIYMECFLVADHPILHNNTVISNTASPVGRGSGGGIFAGYGSNPIMTNNVLLSNTSGPDPASAGAGLYAEYATFTMTHTTISANDGYDANGVCADASHIRLVNSIVAWQAGVGITTVDSNSIVTVTGVLWDSNGGNIGGLGTFSITHAFTGSANFDLDGYHVLSGSLAIGNAVATGVADDIDGQVRPYGAGPDLGADEWWPCSGVVSAVILGPTAGYTNTVYTFTAQAAPAMATPPFTYTWFPDPSSGQGTAMASYAWGSAGSYVLTATIANCGGVATATHTIAITDTPSPCPYPLSGVSIAGPAEAFVGFPVPFAAVVLPANATEPITYSWSPAPDSGQGTALAVYTWASTGTEEVSVDAENCGGSVGDTMLVTIRSEISGTLAPTLSLTIVYTDLQGVSTTVVFPAGAVTETTLISFVPVFSPTQPASPGLSFAGHNFDLNAYRNGSLLPGLAFSLPVTVSIRYSDADVRWLVEDSLQLYYWAGAAWADATATCTPPSAYLRDPAQNWLQVPICHLTQWGMMAIPSLHFDVYLPLVLRSS